MNKGKKLSTTKRRQLLKGNRTHVNKYDGYGGQKKGIKEIQKEQLRLADARRKEKANNRGR